MMMRMMMIIIVVILLKALTGREESTASKEGRVKIDIATSTGAHASSWSFIINVFCSCGTAT